MNLLAATDLIHYIPPEWIFFLVLLFGIAIYMLPTWIAGFTKHPDTVGIAVVNAVFGWSGIGFLLCLIWAFRKPQPAAQQIVQHIGPPPISQPNLPPNKPTLEDQLFLLESLKERKLITVPEYEQRRKRLLDSICPLPLLQLLLAEVLAQQLCHYGIHTPLMNPDSVPLNEFSISCYHLPVRCSQQGISHFCRPVHGELINMEIK